jgi:DNA-binding Lrp family transcriptional regulator
MFVDSAEKEHIVAALSNIEEIKEVYEVAGEYDLVSVVSTSCLEEFRDLLHKRILHIKGIKSTVISVILNLHENTLNHNWREKYIAPSTVTVKR